MAFTFISLSCKKKKNENQQPNSVQTEKKAVLNNDVANIDSHYILWKFAPNNLYKSYKDYTLYISEDSIKILNSGKLVCSGEIVKEKNTFASYFKSSKTGSEKKELLKKDFGIKGTDELLVVMNADGDISKKGCQFPFNDIFIVDGYLFFYKDGYHSFISDAPKDNEDTKQFTFSNLKLPYHKKIDYKNVKYDQLSTKSILGLSEFACNEEQIRYIPLEKTTKNNLIIIPMDCGDTSYRYYLLSIFNNKVVSNLYIEGELYEPESNNPEITSFNIDKKSIFTVKTINKDFQGSSVEKKYLINDKGEIVESR
ncbi:hypothetical protein CRN76_21400 [Chryseobacterium indologenes]|uniref:Uncharacterized protein n=1 Tax=Chryseobacterium indologenes TaxID=253 RepID=A0AAD0YYQ1_CHRID|nr:hypothetical protein CRN76_21400 [Chryseobacterium indologenes]AZB19476.1 hypothetical protein EG352_17705 [Chryseobacterium indologenes]HAO27719.1 hypothetical protein [Chryseobacterium indologenes]